jgi:hypothetical protein
VNAITNQLALSNAKYGIRVGGFARSDLQKSVVEEQADRLRLLIVVGACRPFVAAFRNCLQIALAYLYPKFAEPAAVVLAGRQACRLTLAALCRQPLARRSRKVSTGLYTVRDLCTFAQTRALLWRGIRPVEGCST